MSGCTGACHSGGGCSCTTVGISDRYETVSRSIPRYPSVPCTGACLSRGCNCERPDPIPSDRERHAPVVGRVSFGPGPEAISPSEGILVQRHTPAYADANVPTTVHILMEHRANGEVVLHKAYAFEVAANKECEQRQIRAETAAVLHAHVPSRFCVAPLTVEPD